MYTPRLKQSYQKDVFPALKEKYAIKNVMSVPKLEKVVINVGLGRAVAEPKIVDKVVDDISKITGQKPIITKAKKAISNFKLREGMPIGVKVTLREARMYEFLDRLFNIALPRVRDFRGVSAKGFDKDGNYTLGLKDHTIFPEINIDEVGSPFGMNITVVSTAKNGEQCTELLTALGMPFRKPKTQES